MATDGRGEAVLAARALPFARLLLTLEMPGAAIPAGWARAFDRSAFGAVRRLAAVLGDFMPVAFVDDGARRVAVAFPGTRVNLRGVVAVLRRRIFGGASGLALAFVALARAKYPGAEVIVVGHSSGGGTASFAGAVLALPSLTFNGARTRAALRNDGARQLNVIVRGDFWGDPAILPGRLAGETLWLPGEGLDSRQRHSLSAVVDGLLAASQGPTPGERSAAV